MAAKPTAAASSASIHPSSSILSLLELFELNTTPSSPRFDGRSCGEAGPGAAAVQPAHRRPHRGRVHPVPGPRRRRAGGAGDQLPEGARHDVPQGRVGGGRVHGRRGPARGPGGGRRPRRDGGRAGPLALPEPPVPDDLRGVHVPAPRHRPALPVARDGIPQAHLGNGTASYGRMPARVDA